MAENPRQKSLGLKEAISAPPHFHGHRQRLRERLIAGGADNLPDYELMEVLLFAGNPRGDTKPLAKDLIERFGGFAEALSADPDDLLQVPGLGVAGAAALKSVREAALRLVRAELRDRPVIGSWDLLLDYCRAHIAYGKVEEFHLLFLDRKNALIAHEQQQRGTVDHTPVYTREVVKRALELGASALIWCTTIRPATRPRPRPTSRSPRTSSMPPSRSASSCTTTLSSVAADIRALGIWGFCLSPAFAPAEP
jgi:DNA repair protein RadC